MEGKWKDYFTFSKKERIGIYTLLLLIVGTAILPQFLTSPSLNKELTASAIQLEKAPVQPEKEFTRRLTYEKRPDVNPPATVFRFNPNTLDEAGWKKLGLPDRTVRTILNYRNKGGKFRTIADLQKMYSLKPADFNRLQPYVQIEAPPFHYTGRPSMKYVKAPPTVIDINLADTTAFIALPGIGSKLASRIVNFRNKLGGFYSVEQVGETFGLTDSTFQIIKPRLQCEPVVQKININTADVNTLKQHPYIRWNVANAIVQYRQQHGVFNTREQLQQIVLVTPELYQKIEQYIAVE
ncbi:ComEA family DNA-binding protein [Niastella sp. OAS944]|uniref:ComEA family DNA-binding protein n=1 Tax=Niastella sp. OAS944 TaxID=2664089 RepID=UPI00347474A8|nr:DNA uptake protein ComE-like DNA-binding protein [Chitinophagaceae bacterium OAS944]